MGLNDEYFTVDADQDHQAKVAVDVFKPTNPGDVPELKENVDFIAVSYDDLPEDEEEQMTTNTAIEEACVRLRDLELFAIRLREDGGMSQAAALESIGFLPGLITDDHPVGFYTVAPTRTSLNYAMEEVETEKVGLFAKVQAAVKAFLARIAEWFKRFFEKFNFSKKKEELAKREQDQAAKTKAMEDKIFALKEEIDGLVRASASNNEEFAQRIAGRDKELANKSGQLVKAEGEVAQAKSHLQGLEAQMRVLDDTKNREIAAALDEMDKLRRREEGSRAARIELKTKIDDLGILVHRSMCREAFDLVRHQEKEIVTEYSAFVSAEIVKNELLSKYLFGNGFQNRLQTVKRMTATVLATKPIVHHIEQLKQAFKEAERNPAKLVEVIKGFDFSHFSSPDEVFQKTDGYEAMAKEIQPKRYKEALVELSKEIGMISASLGELQFDAVAKSLGELLHILNAGVQISANTQNIAEVANSYRAFQAHISKLMPYITSGAVAQRNMLAVWNAAIVTGIGPDAFVRSPECATRMASVIKAVSQNISLMESFVNSNMRKLIAEAIIVSASTAYQ